MAGSNENVPATGNKKESRLTLLPSELFLAVLEQTELEDLRALRRVCTKFKTIVNEHLEHLLDRLRKVTSQDFQEKHISETARLLIVVVGMDGDFSDDSLQKWRKMVTIYEEFVRTNGFEAKDWKSCVAVLEGWNSPNLHKARRELWTTLSELDRPILRAFDSWVEIIAASIMNNMLLDRKVGGPTQNKIKEWIKSFTYTVNDRLSQIDTTRSENNRRLRERQRAAYMRRGHALT